MREAELKRLFISPEDHDAAKDLKLFKGVTSGFIGEQGILNPIAKPEGEILDQLNAALKDRAERAEDIELMKEMGGRNDAKGRRKAGASLFSDPLGDFVNNTFVEPLVRIVYARKSNDTARLRETIQTAEGLRDRVISMVKEAAIGQDYPEPVALDIAQAVDKEFKIGLVIATSEDVKTREQALGELGLDR